MTPDGGHDVAAPCPVWRLSPRTPIDSFKEIRFMGNLFEETASAKDAKRADLQEISQITIQQQQHLASSPALIDSHGT